LHADDRVRVLHMIEACESVQRFIQGRGRLDFESDQMLLFAVIRAVEVLGEAAGKVSEDTRSACPEIPWPEITSMRNR